MDQLDYYFSTISPFTYLAGNRVEEIAAKHGLGIHYRPLDIMALFARTGGTPPAQRHPARQEYRLQEIPRQAAKAGLPINVKPAHWPTNGAPAAYAIIAAQHADGGDLGALIHGILRACWAEERDIAEDDVVKSCLEAAGFDPGLADSGLLSGADEYARNLENAVAAGVFGAPFIIAPGDRRFWGQDRLDDLDLALSGKL